MRQPLLLRPSGVGKAPSGKARPLLALALEWPSLLAAVAALAVVGWPAWTAPTRLSVGGDQTEAPGHLWGLWVTTTGLPAHGPFWRSASGLGWPGGLEGHLIDPTSLLLFVPGFLMAGGGAAGATLGWNLLHVGAAAIGCLGTWALARCVVPGQGPAEAGGRAVAVATMAFSAFWLAQPWLGRSEYLGLLLMPGQLAVLLHAVRSGRRLAVLGAGLLLGAVVLEQGYVGLFAALLEGSVGLGLLAVAADRRAAARRLAVVAVVAALVALPAWLALAADPEVAKKFAVSDWPVLDDVLCVLVHACTPLDLDTRIDSPLALGLVPAAFALGGLIVAPRRAGPWVLLTVVLVVLGLGTKWSSIRLPAGWLTSALPVLGVIKSWDRLGSVVPVPLCVAAAVGAQALFRRLPAVAVTVSILLILPLIAIEGMSFPRSTLPSHRPSFEVAPPPGVVEVLHALPAGPVITLPPELDLQADQLVRPAFHALWQRTHGRPISATLDRRIDVLMESSLLVKSATLAISVSPTRALRQYGRPCLLADAGRLAADGWAGVILVGADELGAAELLTNVLGPPVAAQGVALGWPLVEPDEDVEPCPTPDPRDTLRRKPRRGR